MLEGSLPYRDFAYVHTPLAPYLYAAWMKLLGISWWSGRLLSALIAVALGVSLYRQVARLTGTIVIAAVATAMFVMSGVALTWYSPVATIGITSLCVFVAYSVLDWGPPRGKTFLSGLFFGLAVDTRIDVAVVVLALVIEIVRRESGPNAGRQIGWFVAGTVVAVTPVAYFVRSAPEPFLFDVVGHHAIGSGGAGAIDTLLRLLTIHGAEGGTSLQFTILIWLNLAFVAARLVVRERLPASAPIALLLLLIGFLSGATYTHVVAIALPFLILDVALLIGDVRRLLAAAEPAGTIRRRLIVVTTLVGVLYAAAAPVDLYRSIAGSDAPPFHVAADWKLSTIAAVARAVEHELPPDNRTVITWWPGYLVETRARVIPGMEHHLSLWYSTALTADEVSRYRYTSANELVSHIRQHTARLAVLGVFVFDAKPHWRQALTDSGYVMVRRVGETEIYRWDQAR